MLTILKEQTQVGADLRRKKKQVFESFYYFHLFFFFLFTCNGWHLHRGFLCYPRVCKNPVYSVHFYWLTTFVYNHLNHLTILMGPIDDLWLNFVLALSVCTVSKFCHVNKLLTLCEKRALSITTNLFQNVSS